MGPRFLYLFQMIPVYLPKSFFKQLDRLISIFIWNKSPSRIKKASLERPKSEGGLGLPNLLHYYWSANISKLTYWFTSFTKGEGPLWSLMELQSSLPVSPLSLLTCMLPVTLRNHSLNPVVENSIKIWTQFRKHFNFTQMIGLTPLTFNHLFPPSQMDQAFKAWHSCGLVYLVDLFDKNSFRSFSSLCQDNNVPKKHYFRYFQVRSFASKYFSSYPSPPESGPTYDILSLNPYGKGLISKIYDLIQNLIISSWDNIRTAWVDDIGEAISDEMWDSALSLIHSSSFCVRLNLIQFKVFHRLHYSNDKLAKMYDFVCPECPRCRYTPVSLGHMFWSCPSLAGFWSSIFEGLASLCRKTINPNPFTAIFGAVKPEEGLSGRLMNAVVFASLLARRLILRNWKASRPPSFNQWVREVLSMLKLEKIKFAVHGSYQKFDEIWSLFVRYVGGLVLSVDS